MDPQKIIRHISFYDRKPARKPKMFTGDQMTSRQFGGWKQVTTILKDLEATVTSLSAVSQKVTQVQYIGVCYVTHSSQPNFRPIIGHYIIFISY